MNQDTQFCKSIGCCNSAKSGSDFCEPCLSKESIEDSQCLSNKYPDHYKPVGDMTEIDVFAVHHMFQIPDYSGCLQQASNKLLMVGKSQHMYRDIKQARDLLTRWLQLNAERNTP